jgi:hypothetical protein
MLQHHDAHGPPPAREGDADVPPLRALYDAVRDSLDPAKRARFDHDPAGLAQLIASSEGISWDELRVLRGYTVNFNPALDAELRADVADGPRRQRKTTRAAGTYDRRRDVPGGPSSVDRA